MRSAKALWGQSGPKNLVWQRCSFCYNQLNASIIYLSYFVFVNSLFTFVHIIFIFQIKGPVNFNFFCGGRKFRIVFVKTVRDKTRNRNKGVSHTSSRLLYHIIFVTKLKCMYVLYNKDVCSERLWFGKLDQSYHCSLY